MKIIRHFSIFRADDPEGKRTRILLLSTMIVVALCALPLILLMRLSNDLRLYTADKVILFLILALFVINMLLKKGRLGIASILFFSIVWLAITLMAADSNGIRDITVLGYILIIFIAVLIAGYRVAILLTVATIISVWVMAVAEARGLLMPQGEIPVIYARDFTFLILLALTGNLLYERSFRYSFQRINRELSERKAAEEKLSQNEKVLQLRQKELIAAKLEAEESDRLKTAFLQNISHEIRTPMNGIVGFAELLKEPGLKNEKAEEYISMMITCSDQLAAIINDLVDISKIEVGVLELNISEFNSDILINDISILFESAAASKGILLKLENGIPSVNIKSDRGKIFRIISNIIGNAVKFTYEGEVAVKISRQDNNLVVNVSDTGIGIKDAEIEHIFERFRQVETGNTRSFEGSGLGLAICKGNAEFLGGKIIVNSKEGKGSVFRIIIPVEFIDMELYRNHEGIDIISTGQVKILIAEDDEIGFLYLRNIIAKEKIKIIWAKSGPEAVSEFESEPGINMILMDLKLPEMSGFEALKRIRQKNKEIPVIAISAYAFEEDKKRAREAGVNEYISKPFDKNELIIKVNKYLPGLI
jgi:signal transduction histidine kinase